MMFGLGTKAWSAIAGAVVMLGAVFAGVALASGEDFDPVYAPQWQPGYSFSYDVMADLSTHIEGSFNGYTLADEGDIPEDFEATIGPIPVKKEVLATGYEDATGAPVYVSAANVPLSSVQLGTFFDDMGSAPAFATAERQSDLAPVLVFPAASKDGGLFFPDMAPETSQGDSNPITYLNFPLTPDKRWEDTVDMGLPLPWEELSGLDRVHYVGEVTGMETVDLGELGTTEAVRVDIDYTPVGIEEFINNYAAQAEEMGFELERYSLQLGLHEIVYYSEDFEAIVQQDYLVHGLIDLAVTGEVYGEPVDVQVYAEIDALVSALLTGAEQPQGLPDKSPAEILAIVGNPDMIHDATGNSATTNLVQYTLSLYGDSEQINVADGDMAVYGVDLHGVDELPEGHTIVWDVADSNGDAIAAIGDDEALLVQPARPGVYTITASAYDENGVLQSSASDVLYADFDGIVRADGCYFSGLGFDCEVSGLTVSPGIETLVLEAAGGSSLTPSLDDTLSLYDGAGEMVDYDAQRVQVDDFDGLAFGDWGGRLSTIGGTNTDMEFYVLLDYEPGLAPVASADAGDAGSGSGGSGSGSGDDPLEEAFSVFASALDLLP